MRLTKMSNLELKIMATDMADLKSSIGECKECFMLFDKPKSITIAGGNGFLCQFCRDVKRDKNKICVVVSDQDALTIEKTKTFDGVYHILGGYVSLLDKKENLDLNLVSLKDRLALKDKEKTEAILAMNSTTEGQATVMYLEKILSDTGIKITRLAKGLSTGSEIEYADDQTLINALKHRR